MSGTWNLASRRWISTSAEPESNFEKSESGAWILIPALLVPLWTSIHKDSKDNSFEGFFLIFIYLAALGLSCGTQDLCSITRGLLLWLRLLCAVLRLQSTWAQ